MLGLCFGAASAVPASASVPVLGDLLGGEGGVLGLGGIVNGLLNGEGGLLGHEGGVIAGDDTLGDVVEGFASEDDGFVEGGGEIVGAVTDVVSNPNIGGEGSFGGGNGALGGVLGGLLSGGTGLLGGVF